MERAVEEEGRNRRKGEKKRKRDLELNLRGSPQARRRQVPRPPRKISPLRPPFLFFSLSLLHSLPHPMFRHFRSCTPSPVCYPLSVSPFHVPLSVPMIVRLYFRLFVSPQSPFLSFSIFYEPRVRGELPGCSYTPRTHKPRLRVYVYVHAHVD